MKQTNINLFDQEKERSALGAIALSPSFLKKAQDFLGSVEVFTSSREIIYKKMLTLKPPWDSVILRGKLTGEVKSEFSIAVMSAATAIPWNMLKRYLEELKTLAVKREQKDLLEGLNQASENGKDPREALNDYIEGFAKLEDTQADKGEVETAQELLNAELPKKRYFIGMGLLPIEGFSMIVGKPKLRKTTLALYECLCGATKTDLFLRENEDKRFAFPLENGFTSLYLYSEGSRAFFKTIFRKQKEGLEQLTRREITDKEMNKIKLVRNRDIFLDTKPGQAKLKKLLRANASDLVVLDPLARMVTGDLSDAKDVLKVISLLDKLGQEFGCAFLLVHHSRKGTGESKSEDPYDEILGSVVWRMSYESCIMVLGRSSKRRSALMQDLLFELRNEPEPMPRSVKFDPDTLIPRPLTDDEKLREKSITMEQVVEILKTEYNGSERETLFTEALGERFEVTPKHIYNLLKEAQEAGLVTKERGRGKPWCIAETGPELFDKKT